LAAAAPPQPQPDVSVAASSNFAEMVSFMREEREQAKSERAEMEAKIEQQRLAMESQRVQMEAKLEQFAQQAQAATDAKLDQAEARVEYITTEQQLPALQARIEALHAAKLLSDDELFSIEDLIADLEVGSEDTRVGQLITLSSRMAGDAAFSRQIRRKVL
jgi:hypothetical protein